MWRDQFITFAMLRHEDISAVCRAEQREMDTAVKQSLHGRILY